MTPIANAPARLACASAVVAVTAAAARRDQVGQAEEHVFRMVNDLPDSINRPVWLVMQLGTVGAAPAAAGVAWAAGDGPLASRLLIGGVSTWALSKAFKRVIGRARPAALLTDTHMRGSDPAGLGYLSGHAGVTAALGVSVLPRLSPPARIAVGVLVPAVGLARMYVGAHLPLDVLGGAALGVAVEAATGLIVSAWSPSPVGRAVPSPAGWGRRRATGRRCMAGSGSRSAR